MKCYCCGEKVVATIKGRALCFDCYKSWLLAYNTIKRGK